MFITRSRVLIVAQPCAHVKEFFGLAKSLPDGLAVGQDFGPARRE